LQSAVRAPLTAEAIRKKACALGIRLRPVRAPRQSRVLLGDDTRVILIRAAVARGVSVARLAWQVLTSIAFHGLVGPLLDVKVPSPKARLSPPYNRGTVKLNGDASMR
jgi:hypothetical protein